MEACNQAIVMGASAGALDALSAILPMMPTNYQKAIILVVHLPPDRHSILPELLQNKCRLSVHEAEDKEPIHAAHVYIAPPDYHVLIEQDKRISLSSEEPVHFSRPSIDVLFTSAAEAYKNDLIGVILTGANQDGAEGLRTVCQNGGVALVQRPDLADSPEMPLAALAACPEAQAMSLPEIATYLSELGTR